MKLPASLKYRSAFTLIELVISGGLMSVILVSAYVCLTAGTGSQRMVEARADSGQGGRVALAMLAADLRSAVPLSKEMEFIGMRRTVEEIDADNLDFATRNYTPRNAAEGDWCETSYFVQKDSKTGGFVLYRRRDPSPDPEPIAGGNQEELVRGVRGLRLEYYDGFDWWDEWGDPEGKQRFATFPDPNVSGLPEAVRITLTLESGEKAEPGETSASMVLQTTARLNMALYFYRSTSGGTSTNSSSSAPEQGPAPTTGGPP